MRWLRFSVPALALSGAVIAAACSSDNGTNSTQQPIPPAGTYAITSITQSGVSLDTPLVSGQFILSAPNKYKVRILVTVPSPDSIVDSGTYNFSPPNNVTLNSTTAGAALAGTYSYDSTSGVLQVVVPSQSLKLNAKKQ